MKSPGESISKYVGKICAAFETFVVPTLQTVKAELAMKQRGSRRYGINVPELACRLGHELAWEKGVYAVGVDRHLSISGHVASQ